MISKSELEALLEENEGLRFEIRRLRGKRPEDLCWPCEKKRRWLAVALGAWLGLCWHLWFAGAGARWMKDNVAGLDIDAAYLSVLALASIGPLVGVYAGWKIRLFKRRETWKSWPLYSAVITYREARRKAKLRR